RTTRRASAPRSSPTRRRRRRRFSPASRRTRRAKRRISRSSTTTATRSPSPTLVEKDGRVVLALGSPGGARIITTVLETALNLIDYGMELQDAVDAPRFHHQWLPDAVFAEPYAFSPDTQKLLEAMGYKIIVQAPWSAAEVAATAGAAPGAGGPAAGNPDSVFGGAMRPGFLYGANDDRRPAGAAVGE